MKQTKKKNQAVITEQQLIRYCDNQTSVNIASNGNINWPRQVDKKNCFLLKKKANKTSMPVIN